MKKIWLSCAAILFAAATTFAAPPSVQDDSKAKPATQEDAKPADPADEPAQEEAEEDYSGLSQEEALEKVTALTEEFNDGMNEFRKKFQAASTEEKIKLRADMPKADLYIEKFQKLAGLHPKTDVEGQSLLWIVQHQRNGDVFEASLKTLIANHAGMEEIRPIIMSLQYQPPSARSTELLEMVKQSEDRDLRGVALYAFLQYQKRVAEIKVALEGDAESAERYEKAYGKEQVEFLKQMATLSDDERLAALEQLNADYGDVKLSEDRTLASSIEGDIFEAKFLQIGKEVPDIEGEDIDGTPFKLSDYRGKVVLLDFWGDW